jgi:hypothetical protein
MVGSCGSSLMTNAKRILPISDNDGPGGKRTGMLSAVKEDHSLSGVWAPTMKWAKKPPEKNTLGGAYQRSTARPSARPPFPWHAPARGRRMRRRFAQMEKYGQSLSQVSADR